jgi:hypothetical protein
MLPFHDADASSIPKGQSARRVDETVKSLKTIHCEHRKPELAWIAPHEIEANCMEPSEHYRSS